MDVMRAVLLGFTQGVTEFLPVSSSGHLVLLQSLVNNFQHPGVMFEAILHLGTLLAVLIYFHQVLIKLSLKYFLLLVVGTIPVVIFGAIFADFFESLFDSTKIVGVALIFTAIVNYFTWKEKRESKNLNLISALIIGVAQTIAIVPGISRSGMTIFAGAKQGIGKEKAAEFSFLLSIPAIIGANILQFVKYGWSGDINFKVTAFGFIAAFVSGYVAIWLVFRMLSENKYRYFAVYALVVGIFALVL